MKRHLVGVVVAVLLFSFSVVGTAPAELSDTQLDVYIKIIKATVQVFYGADFESVYGEKLSVERGGGGVLIAPDLILTCYHMAAEAPKGHFVVRHFDGKTIETRVTSAIVRFSKEDDLLLIRVTPPFKNADPVRLAKALPSLGEEILFVGHTMFIVPRMRFGKYNFMPSRGILLYPVYRGDSGGGAYNTRGELIGIIYSTMCIRDGGSETQTLVGYAISLEKLAAFMELTRK